MEENSDYLYAKVHHHMDIRAGQRFEPVADHRSVINHLLQQLKAKGLSREAKELARVIEKWQQSMDDRLTTKDCSPERDRLYHLRLLDVEKLLQHLDGCFLRVLEDTRQHRLQELYSQYAHILHRVRKLEATDIHANSTRMKRHLLDEVKDQQQKRLRAERQQNLLIEETQKVLYEKDRKVKELQAALQQLENALGKKDRLIRQLRLGHDGTDEGTLQKDRSIRELRSDNDKLRIENDKLCEKVEQLSRDITEKDENMDDYYRTVETLKKTLQQTRTQLANDLRPRECPNCAGDSINEHSKTMHSAKILKSSNSYSTTNLNSPGGAYKQKMPPIQPKTHSRSGSLAEEDGFQLDNRNVQLFRMLMVQASGMQQLLKECNR